MKIVVVGSGYVGLVASACMAEMGHHVLCVDRDAVKIERIKSGHLPIYEPGLDELVAQGMNLQHLAFSTDLRSAVSDASAVFIAVGTPDSGKGSKPDLSSVFEVAEEIAAAAGRHCVVVTKSTVPAGTGDAIETILLRHSAHPRFDVVSNPEFLREGRAIRDFRSPDRIVIGVESERARDVMMQIYGNEFLGRVPILITGRRTAELMKYASNAFLASKVAFINDVADLCERVGADIQDISYGMGLDARIGRDFLQAGPGFGGSCLPKDTSALTHMAHQFGAPSGLFESIVAANIARKRGLANRVIAACGGTVAGRDVALLGLTFKADTDDMRESPALPLIRDLQASGARVRAYDPAGMTNAARMVDNVHFTNDPYACVTGASAVVLVTDWPEFRQLDLRLLGSLAAEPIVVDLRNLYDPAEMIACGLTYVGLGRHAHGAGRPADLRLPFVQTNRTTQESAVVVPLPSKRSGIQTPIQLP